MSVNHGLLLQTVEQIKTAGKRKLDVFLHDAKSMAREAGMTAAAGGAASGAAPGGIGF